MGFNANVRCHPASKSNGGPHGSGGKDQQRKLILPAPPIQFLTLTLSLTGGWRILPTNFQMGVTKKTMKLKQSEKNVILPCCLFVIFYF